MGAPPSGDLWLTQVAALLNALLDQIEPTFVGWRNDGTNLNVRFRAAIGTPYVRIHVQDTDPGKGGGTFDPVNFVSEVDQDCRAGGLQDVTLAELPYGRYWVWLIPVQIDGAGAKLYFDGQSGRPDRMAFIDIGV
jgi:hypothetical protein